MINPAPLAIASSATCSLTSSVTKTRSIFLLSVPTCKPTGSSSIAKYFGDHFSNSSMICCPLGIFTAQHLFYKFGFLHQFKFFLVYFGRFSSCFHGTDDFFPLGAFPLPFFLEHRRKFLHQFRPH